MIVDQKRLVDATFSLLSSEKIERRMPVNNKMKMGLIKKGCSCGLTMILLGMLCLWPDSLQRNKSIAKSSDQVLGCVSINFNRN